MAQTHFVYFLGDVHRLQLPLDIVVAVASNADGEHVVCCMWCVPLKLRGSQRSERQVLQVVAVSDEEPVRTSIPVPLQPLSLVSVTPPSPTGPFIPLDRRDAFVLKPVTAVIGPLRQNSIVVMEC